MKKIIVFIFMLCSLLSVMIVTSKGVSASEETEIEAFAHYEFNDEVPKDVDKLLTLPGVGIKTINVVLAEGFKIPAFPVDTHVNRVAKRLYFATLKDDVNDVERKLKKKIDKELWIQMHHSMIFFGRYFCKAIAPRCNECALKGKCRVNYK